MGVYSTVNFDDIEIDVFDVVSGTPFFIYPPPIMGIIYSNGSDIKGTYIRGTSGAVPQFFAGCYTIEGKGLEQHVTLDKFDPIGTWMGSQNMWIMLRVDPDAGSYYRIADDGAGNITVWRNDGTGEGLIHSYSDSSGLGHAEIDAAGNMLFYGNGPVEFYTDPLPLSAGYPGANPYHYTSAVAYDVEFSIVPHSGTTYYLTGIIEGTPELEAGFDVTSAAPPIIAPAQLDGSFDVTSTPDPIIVPAQLPVDYNIAITPDPIIAPVVMAGSLYVPTADPGIVITATRTQRGEKEMTVATETQNGMFPTVVGRLRFEIAMEGGSVYAGYTYPLDFSIARTDVTVIEVPAGMDWRGKLMRAVIDVDLPTYNRQYFSNWRRLPQVDELTTMDFQPTTAPNVRPKVKLPPSFPVDPTRIRPPVGVYVPVERDFTS